MDIRKTFIFLLLFAILGIAGISLYQQKFKPQYISSIELNKEVEYASRKIHDAIVSSQSLVLENQHISYAIYSKDSITRWRSRYQFPNQWRENNYVELQRDTLSEHIYTIGVEIGENNLNSTSITDYQSSGLSIKTVRKQSNIAYIYLIQLLLFVLLYLSVLKLLSYLSLPIFRLSMVGFTALLVSIYSHLNIYPVLDTGILYIDAFALILLGFNLLLFSRWIYARNFSHSKALSILSYAGIVASIYAVYMLQSYYFHHAGIYQLDTISIIHNFSGILYLMCFTFVCISLFFLHYSIAERLTHVVASKERIMYMALGCIGGSIGFLYFSMPWLGMLGFTVAYLLILDLFTEKRVATFVYGFSWILLLAGFLAATTYHILLQEDLSERKNIHTQLVQDPSTDLVHALIHLDSTLIENNAFLPLAELPLQSSLEHHDYRTYLAQNVGIKAPLQIDHLQLFAFDKDGYGLLQNTSQDYQELTYAINLSNKVKGSIRHNPLSNTYYRLYKIEQSTTDRLIDVILVYSPDKDVIATASSLGYLIQKEGKTIYTHNVSDLDVDISKLSAIEQDGLVDEYHVVATTHDRYRIISYKRNAGIVRAISLFSLILAIAALFALVLSVGNRIIKLIPQQIGFKAESRSSLRVRLQTSIILLIVFSFIIIGVVTTYYFQNVLNTSRNTEINVQNQSILSHIMSETHETLDPTSSENIWSNIGNRLNRIHERDISILNQKYNLLYGSNAPNITQSQWQKLRIGGSVYRNNSEALESIYPVFHKNTKPIAYVAITSPLSKNRYSILDFLSTILNVYVFLFLIAGAIAIAMSNSITRPLVQLTEKLKAFKLGKQNEAIEWSSKDEIGTLINDYNNLSIKLKESAEIIAKTHRDSAWREMAKQVAHEIKNPLTPMKLTLQYLERRIAASPDRAQEIIQRTSHTLLEQIDNLSKIADEFSNFATMPKITNQEVVLNEVVETIHDLFRKREDLEIHLSLPIQDIRVFADKNQLSRVIINIVKNAIQAIPADRKGKIEMQLFTKNNHAIVSIKDNGCGISEAMKTRVFEPNFTTKSSGTGLGLAMSANIIEAFNGKLYFETEEGAWTIFYVEIPLMKYDNASDGVTRITLD